MLIDLDPRSTGLGKLCENVCVCRNNIVKALEGIVIGGCFISLSDGEEGHGANQHGADNGAFFIGGEETLDDRTINERNRSIRANLGNQVVVVRIEPLSHLQGRNLRIAASEGKVQIQTFERAVALGNRAQKGDCVQNLVVEREGFGDRRVIPAEAELDKAVMRGLAQQSFRRAKFLGGNAARPVGFERLLQLAATTDARVTQDGRRRELSHLLILCHREMDGSKWLAETSPAASSTSRAGAALLKVYMWMPGAPASCRSRASRAPKETPTEYISSTD